MKKQFFLIAIALASCFCAVAYESPPTVDNPSNTEINLPEVDLFQPTVFISNETYNTIESAGLTDYGHSTFAAPQPDTDLFCLVVDVRDYGDTVGLNNPIISSDPCKNQSKRARDWISC